MERKVTYFQEGNTVRKVYELPERERRTTEKVHTNTHRRTYRQTEKAPRMSLGMVLLLALSVIVSVLGCIDYLKAQAEIAEINRSIDDAETKLDTLKTQNDSIQYEIDSFVDVEYIISVAKEQLGMVMVGEAQIVTYESTRDEYMEQYADVPSK